MLVSESKGRFETNYVFKIWIHLYKVRKKEKNSAVLFCECTSGKCECNFRVSVCVSVCLCVYCMLNIDQGSNVSTIYI